MLPVAIKREIDEWTYRLYVTDTLQAIAENAAYPAAYVTDGKAGKTIGRRWADLDKPAPPEEPRTADEIIAQVRKRLEEVS